MQAKHITMRQKGILKILFGEWLSNLMIVAKDSLLVSFVIRYNQINNTLFSEIYHKAGLLSLAIYTTQSRKSYYRKSYYNSN